MIESTLHRIWYGRSPLHWLLYPLSLVFGGVVRARHALYSIGWCKTHRVPAPVVVVGNLTVGGTGKTPLAIWLTQALAARHRRPGVVLRGYGGAARDWPRRVTAEDDPALVGDEAVLIADETSAIVVAGPDRVAAAHHAVELGADVIVCDDGLQHYRLARDLEIAVFDAERLVGNGALLPAGPMREPLSRLERVDLIALNDRGIVSVRATPSCLRIDPDKAIRFSVVPDRVIAMTSRERRSLADFRGMRVHAVAGIGHPEPFFGSLEQAGLRVVRHAPGDHVRHTAGSLAFGDDAPILMTAKDAVKCRGFADARFWVVGARVEMDDAAAQRLLGVIGCVIDSRAAPAVHSRPSGLEATD
jgi:tetraacyldisaccharide 4'-kinase